MTPLFHLLVAAVGGRWSGGNPSSVPSALYSGQAWIKDGGLCTVTGTTNTAAAATTAPWSESEGCCLPPYDRHAVVSDGLSLVHQSTSDKASLAWCGPEAEGCYQPGDSIHHDHVWTIGGLCGGSLSPSSGDASAIGGGVLGGCPKEWEPRPQDDLYQSGDRPSSDGVVRECKIWPLGLHPSQDGFEPMAEKEATVNAIEFGSHPTPRFWAMFPKVVSTTAGVPRFDDGQSGATDVEELRAAFEERPKLLGSASIDVVHGGKAGSMVLGIHDVDAFDDNGMAAAPPGRAGRDVSLPKRVSISRDESTLGGNEAMAGNLPARKKKSVGPLHTARFCLSILLMIARGSGCDATAAGLDGRLADGVMVHEVELNAGAVWSLDSGGISVVDPAMPGGKELLASLTSEDTCVGAGLAVCEPAGSGAAVEIDENGTGMWVAAVLAVAIALAALVLACLGYDSSGSVTKSPSRSLNFRFRNRLGMFLFMFNIQCSSCSNLADTLVGFVEAWANFTVDCWDDAIQDYKEDVVEPLTSKTGFYSYEFDNVDGCNIIPTQRTPNPDGTNSKFIYFQPNSILFETLDILFEFITCPFQAIVEAAIGEEVDIDIAALIEDLAFPPDDLPLVDLVAESECVDSDTHEGDVLGFNPAPYKDGWSTITLDDETCVLDECDESTGKFCCDQVVSDGQTLGIHQCGGHTGTSCSWESTRCLRVGTICGANSNPYSIPCCHEKNDETGGVWYVDCADIEGLEVCQDPDVENTEPDCIASGYECTSDDDCCQYSDPLVFSTAMVCYKDLVDGNLAPTGVCQKRSQESYMFEPFCLAWNAGGPLDTFGFAFPKGFPPLPLEPTAQLFQILPTKGKIAEKLLPTSSASICKLHRGIKIADITSLGAVLLFQFIGVAGSSSNRLEYGANKFTRNADYDNAVPLIWDGFLSIPLPPKPGIDFWMAFTLELYPLPTWQYKKLDCQLGGKFKKFAEGIGTVFQGSQEAQQLIDDKWNQFYIKATIEVYVDGGGDGSGACVLATMSRIELGFSFLTLIIGRGIGGWCKHDYPEVCSEESNTDNSQTESSLPIFDDECKNQCDPSGFFMNVEPTLEFGSVADTGFDSFMYLVPEVEGLFTGEVKFEFDNPFAASDDEEPTDVEDVCEANEAVNEEWEEDFVQFFEDAEEFVDEEIDLQGGFSVGVFLGDDDDVKAIVARIESPQIYIFGIPVIPFSAKIHFQWYKGSEMERRRGSILRIEVQPGVFHVNCPVTTNGCEDWKPYKRIDPDTGIDEYNGQVQVCEDSLWDLEDYNRVLIAQVANPYESPVGDPPLLVDRDTAPSVWYVNPQFDLSAYPDSGVTLIYLQCSAWLVGPLLTLDTLSFFVTINTLRPEDLSAAPLDENATEAMVDAYDRGDNETAFNEFEEQLNAGSSAIANRKVQNVYMQVEMGITALFFFSIRGSAVLRNNPRGNEDFKEWVLGWHVSTFSRILENSPWDWEASGITDRFPWDNSDATAEQADERRFLQEFTPPSNIGTTINFQFFGIPLSEIFEAIEEFWSNTILPALNAIKDAIANVMTEIGNFLQGLAQDVAVFFEPLSDVINECNPLQLFTPQGRDDCGNAIESGIDSYKEKWDDFKGLFESGGFFESVGETLVSEDFWKDLGTELDPCKRSYEKYRRVRSDPNSCKDSCGDHCYQKCHDEYMCRIAYRQKAECIDYLCRTNRADTCEGWRDDFSVEPYYDYDCQEQVLESLANVDELRTESHVMSESVEENEERRVKGLKHAVENPGSTDFSANVGSSQFVVASLDGIVSESINVEAKADRLKILRPDSNDPREDSDVDLQEDVYVDFMSMTEDEVREAFTGAFTASASQKVLSETSLSDDVQAYSPEIEAPSITFDGSLELVLSGCAAGTTPQLGAAWKLGITGISAFLKKKFLPSLAIDVTYDPRSSAPVFRWVRTAYSFGCQELEVSYQVTAVSGNHVSNALVFVIKVPYGESTIVVDSSRNQTVQTTCRDELYDSESLTRYGMDRPALSQDRNCPNPDVVLREADSTENTGLPCTTNYTVIHRTWYLDSSSGECFIPSSFSTHTQVITLGGLNSGFLDFNASNTQYELSNDRANGSAVFKLADVYNDDSVYGACGDVCSVTTLPLPFVDGNAIGCELLGDNEVTIEVINDAGTLVTKTVTVTVVDPHPPVIERKSDVMKVALDSNEDAEINTSEQSIGSLFSWHDNCAVTDLTLSRDASAGGNPCNEDGSSCAFSCKDTYDGGPSEVSLLVVDSSGNTEQESVVFFVIDASDRDGDALLDCSESRIYFTNADEATRRCPDAYTLGNSYGPGDIVSQSTANGINLVYRCTSDAAAAQFCGMAGYEPGDDSPPQHWKMVWSDEGPCEVITSPTSAPNFDILPDLGVCPEEWQQGDYQAGDRIGAGELVFECQQWPQSLHCGQEGYSPLDTEGGSLTVPVWKDVWAIVGHCLDSIRPCPEEFSSDAVYEAGDQVAISILTTFERMFVYECNPAAALWCSMVGFEPRSVVSNQMQIWMPRGSCSNQIVSTASDIDMAEFIGGCPSEFDDGTTYETGDLVSKDGRVFQCKPEPFGAHCSNVGFAPLNTNYPNAWQLAWTDIGTCSGTVGPTPSPTPYNNDASSPIAADWPCQYRKCREVEVDQGGAQKECFPAPVNSWGDDPIEAYDAGSVVRIGIQRYKCKGFPYDGWCRLAAYGPGLNDEYWPLCWEEDGECPSAERDEIAAT